jgi:hypothetical protein
MGVSCLPYGIIKILEAACQFFLNIKVQTIFIVAILTFDPDNKIENFDTGLV